MTDNKSINLFSLLRINNTHLLTKKNKEILKFFRNSFIPPLIIITGDPGLGKTTFAKLIAKYINCLQPSLECDENVENKQEYALINASVQIVKKVADYYLEFNSSNYSSINDVKEIIQFSSLSPSIYQSIKYKILCYDECHSLSNAAQSLLLKETEEPKDFIRYILITTKLNVMLDALVDRGFVIVMNYLEREYIEQYILFICNFYQNNQKLFSEEYTRETLYQKILSEIVGEADISGRKLINIFIKIMAGQCEIDTTNTISMLLDKNVTLKEKFSLIEKNCNINIVLKNIIKNITNNKVLMNKLSNIVLSHSKNVYNSDTMKLLIFLIHQNIIN